MQVVADGQTLDLSFEPTDANGNPAPVDVNVKTKWSAVGDEVGELKVDENQPFSALFFPNHKLGKIHIEAVVDGDPDPKAEEQVIYSVDLEFVAGKAVNGPISVRVRKDRPVE